MKMLTQKQLAEFRHSVDIMNAHLKRNKEKPFSYQGVSCGCGCGAFISKRDTDLKPPIPPQPKKPTKQQKSNFCKIARDKLRQIQKEEQEVIAYIQKNIDFPWSVPYNYSEEYRDSMFGAEQKADLYWQNQTDFL